MIVTVLVLVLVLVPTVVLAVPVVVGSVVMVGGVVSGTIVTLCVGGPITAVALVVVVVVDVLLVPDGLDDSLMIAQISTTNNNATSTPDMNIAAGLRCHGAGGSGGGP